MRLARRLTYTILACCTGLILLALIPLWVMHGVGSAIHLAYDEYKELRMVEAAGHRLALASGLLGRGRDPGELRAELEGAVRELDAFVRFQANQSSDEPEHESQEMRIALEARGDIDGLLADWPTGGAGPDAGHPEPAEMRPRIDAIAAELGNLSDQTAREIADSHRHVLGGISRAMIVSVTLALLTGAGVVGLSLIQYRGVIRPLRRLREGVQAVAGGDFAGRIEANGHDEFAQVLREFNRMAAELQALYQGLEAKVARASGELARSERLASVGFLAAGVAHEINNPLNIISGYTELMLRHLERMGAAKVPGEMQERLQIIREESFRCKQITEKLLSLARMGGGERIPVNLGRIAGEVVRMVQGLDQFRSRRLVQQGPLEGPVILANEPEIRQVILNLVLNAIEAVDPETGEVRVTVEAEGRTVRLSVDDNGRGIDPNQLDRVFEPFFTERRGAAEPGTGLGLSITHAIIEAHGGRIRAESAGPGRGARFTVEFQKAA
jgi:signal transduction histidine kinase